MTTEDMIRALGNVIEEYKNKPVFTGQTNIPIMCRDVIGKLKELSSPWHTGTPIEKGVYLCASENEFRKYGLAYWDGEGFHSEQVGMIIAWQKIEPYKENEDGRTD